MTRKQMKKLAKQFYDCERVHQNKASSPEEKSQAEKQIMQLTQYIMSLPDGISNLLEIDTYIQTLVKNNTTTS